MTAAEKIRVVLRAAGRPLTFAEIREREPAAVMNALWPQVKVGHVRCHGQPKHYTYELVSEPRPFRLTAAQRTASRLRNNARQRAIYAERTQSRVRPAPVKKEAAKREPRPAVAKVGPATRLRVTRATQAAPRKRIKPVFERESVETWMARTGQRPQVLTQFDISTPFRVIGRTP